MDDPVQDQYEAYPYPARSAEEEDRRLITGSPSHLDEINHYLFGGQRDFSGEFRALVAGGGTGDATIMLAQQLADRGAGQVVYLDLSRASRATTEARAERRGLKNITFVSGALEDLATLAPGPYDYIDCCGVLHHLASPEAGLKVLADALAPGGGLGLMVYGEYGRTGLYPMQAMMRTLGADSSLAERVTLAHQLYDALPRTNWLKRNPFLGDHKRSDAELVDLFLHARDRAYSVPQLYDLVETAALGITAFIEPARYDPASYIDDPTILSRLAPLSSRERASFAETLAGNLKKHIVYLAPVRDSADRTAAIQGGKSRLIPGRASGPELARALSPDGSLTVDLDGIAVKRTLPAFAPGLLRLVDGKTTLEVIHRRLQEQHPALDWLAFRATVDGVVAVLESLNLLWIANR